MADRAPPSTASRPSSTSPSESLDVRPGVKALVSTDERALLVRERHADGTPFWTLPGGGIHPTESPASALERELAEELRCECVPGDPVTAFWYVHASLPGTVSAYTVRTCALLTRPTPVAAEGVTDLRWVTPDSLPLRTLPQVRTVLETVLDES